MTDSFQKNLAFLEKLLKKNENRYCADCRRKSPSWASTTFGTFICIKCSGILMAKNRIPQRTWSPHYKSQIRKP